MGLGSFVLSPLSKPVKVYSVNCAGSLAGSAPGLCVGSLEGTALLQIGGFGTPEHPAQEGPGVNGDGIGLILGEIGCQFRGWLTRREEIVIDIDATAIPPIDILIGLRRIRLPGRLRGL